VEDYRRLHNRINELANSPDNLCRNIIILGSGLLATELAYSLNRRFARDKKEPKFKIVQIVEDKGLSFEDLLYLPNTILL
jgi:NADH dehydrogenase FAD-containing subunit